MKWPWRRRCELGPSPEAAEAVQQARRQMRDVQRFAERADEVADQLHRIYRRNHIAEAVIQAIKGDS